MLWIKALHIIAVISWMAGLLYLPRLFVYHCGTGRGSETDALFQVMERRLLKAIMLPAAVVVWGTGLYMAIEGGLFQHGWFHAKLTLVVAMTVMHFLMTRWKNGFAKGENQRTSRFFRITNEIPTILMIVVVMLVVLKP